MKRCTKSYMVLGLTQWTEVMITRILQEGIMKLQELSQSHTVGFYLVTTIDIAQEFILGGYSWGGGEGWRWRDTEGLEANAHLCLTGGWKHLRKVHPWVGMRLPPGRFQLQSPIMGVTDRLHTEQAVLSGWNPALFFDSGITGESREGKRRKHKKFQHMSSICNVIYVFWAKLLYTLWGELQINDETFWNMAYT